MTHGAGLQPPAAPDRHKVVVVGSGFGGLFGTKALKDAPVDVTMVANTTHHLFQPLLYQVATGILSEGEIAPPTREILRGQKNANVILGQVDDIDLEARTVTSTVLNRTVVTPYDSLIVAAGAGSVLLRQRPVRRVRARHEEHRRRARAARPDLRRLRAGRDLRGRGGDPAAADLRGRRRRPHRGRDGRPDRRARAPHAVQGLPPDQHPRGPHHPARRRPARCCRRSAPSWARRRKKALEKLGVEVQLGAHGRRRRRVGPRRAGQGRHPPPHRGHHQGVGRRRAGEPAGQAPGGADRRPARPGRAASASTPTSPCPATPRCSWSAT